MSMEESEEEKEERRKHPQNLKKEIMMQCSLHVNDTADCTADSHGLAHELFLCAHRWQRPVVRSISAG